MCCMLQCGFMEVFKSYTSYFKNTDSYVLYAAMWIHSLIEFNSPINKKMASCQSVNLIKSYKTK